MNGTNHLAFGTTVSIMTVLNMDMLANTIPNIPNTTEMKTLIILGGVIGSLLPDIDNPTGHVGKLCAPVSNIFGAIHKLQGKEVWQHRGIMHDLSVYIIGLIFSYLFFLPIFGIFLGGITHLLLDMFNPAGVPVFLGMGKVRLGYVKSNDKTATYITVILCVISVLIGAFIYKI